MSTAYTFNNWKAGKFSFTSYLFSKIEQEYLSQMFKYSHELLLDKGNKEAERLRRIFEKNNSKSIDTRKSIKTELKLYESYLSTPINDGSKGYFKPLGLYYQSKNYDVQFILGVQIKSAKLIKGELNIIIPNPKKESFDYNGNFDCYCAVTAIAWNKYIDYLKTLSKTPAKNVDLNSPVLVSNPFPHIFSDIKAYQFFNRLREGMVKEKTEYSDFSYIFNRMKREGYINDIKHKVFIDFVDKYCKSQIAKKGYNQLKFSKSSLKDSAYIAIKRAS